MNNIDVDKLIRGIREMRFQLEMMNAVPSRVELTETQFEALKNYCCRDLKYMDAMDSDPSFMGLKIVVVKESPFLRK